MQLSTDVKIQKEAVSFPHRCVVCDSEEEVISAQLRGSPVGFHGFIPWLFGATRKLKVPTHGHCINKLRTYLVFRHLSMIIISTLVIIVALSYGLSKWQTLGCGILAIAIPIFWQVIRPLPFEFTYRSGEFKLMFLRQSYASEVAKLNGGELEDEEKSESESGPRE